LEAASLAEASRVFNASLKLREVLPNIVEMALKLLGNTALVFIVRENTDLIYPVSFLSSVSAPPGMPEPQPVKNSPPVKVGLTLVGKVVQTGTPIFINHNADTPRIAPFIREMDGVDDIICVPLKVRGRIIGALVTYNMTFNGHIKPNLTLEDRHISLAQALADRAAVAIANSQMYEAERREQRAKDEFLSLIAHELKTPLTALKGYNRLLGKQVEEKDTEPQKLKESLQHYSGVMDNQLERLQTLVEDLTSISLIETNQLELHTRPADIVPIIKNQVAEMEKVLKSARLPRMIHQFELRSQPTSVMGIVDVPAFERVIHSLLSNAVKFSPKGGTIRMRVQQVVDEVLFTIQDEGLGISIEEQGLIFQRFYKASSAAARANGLGLGLYISQGLMKAMGGRIEVESEEGGGSVFTVALRAVPTKPQ
jgi:signal transduction histidine kinase